MKKLFTIATFLLLSTFAFAELPHTFKNGDILSADMLNKNFEFLEGNVWYKYQTVRANGKIIGRGSTDHGYLQIIFRSDYKQTDISKEGVISNSEVYFSGENCTGTPYYSTLSLPSTGSEKLFITSPMKGRFINVKEGDINKLYYYPPKAQLYKLTIKSVYSPYSFDSAPCTNETKDSEILVKLLPNDPAVTGIDTYPFPTPITIDGNTGLVIVE